MSTGFWFSETQCSRVDWSAGPRSYIPRTLNPSIIWPGVRDRVHAGGAGAVPLSHKLFCVYPMSRSQSSDRTDQSVFSASVSLLSCPSAAGLAQIVGVVSSSGEVLLNLSSEKVRRALGSPRMFQRVVRAGWLKPLGTSRDNVYPVSRVIEVQRRLESGELPPLLPSEERQRDARRASRASAN